MVHKQIHTMACVVRFVPRNINEISIFITISQKCGRFNSNTQQMMIEKEREWIKEIYTTRFSQPIRFMNRQSWKLSFFFVVIFLLRLYSIILKFIKSSSRLDSTRLNKLQQFAILQKQKKKNLEIKTAFHSKSNCQNSFCFFCYYCCSVRRRWWVIFFLLSFDTWIRDHITINSKFDLWDHIF